MKWLVTGGCGFLGTSLVRNLVRYRRGEIRIVDNLSVGSKSDLALVTPFEDVAADACRRDYSGVQLVEGDILDSDLAVRASLGADVIVHLAANTGVGPSVEDPRADLLANVVGTFNYLEAARINRVARFVFASSGAPAGDVEPPIHEEVPPHPVSPYGAGKLAGEGYCSAYKRTFGVDTVILRFGNVYGPGSANKSSVVAKFIRRAVSGETLEIYGDGAQTRDFIYIDDLIDAVLFATSMPGIGGETFQIASSHETTVSELAAMLLNSLELAGVKRVELRNTETRLGDVRRNYSDTTKARVRLGWTPKVSLPEGLRRTVDYFLNVKPRQNV